MKLIDKDALVAEIEKEIKNIYAGREYVGIPYSEECIVRGLQKAEDITNTLEVIEVSLEEKLPVSNSLTEEGVFTFKDGSQAIITKID